MLRRTLHESLDQASEVTFYYAELPRRNKEISGGQGMSLTKAEAA